MTICYHKVDEHVDTYPYVFLLEHPKVDEGGELVFVPNSLEVDELGTEKAFKTTFHAGECYFMRAGSNVHCVLPLPELILLITAFSCRTQEYPVYQCIIDLLLQTNP